MALEPGPHLASSTFSSSRLRVTTLIVWGLTAYDLDKILIWIRDDVIDVPVLSDTHSTGSEVRYFPRLGHVLAQTLSSSPWTATAIPLDSLRVTGLR